MQGGAGLTGVYPVPSTQAGKKGDEAVDDEEGEKIKVPFSRLLALHKPEWYYGIVGCISSAGVGAVQPVFALVISSMITVFYITNPDELKSEASRYRWGHAVVVVGWAGHPRSKCCCQLLFETLRGQPHPQLVGSTWPTTPQHPRTTKECFRVVALCTMLWFCCSLHAFMHSPDCLWMCRTAHFSSQWHARPRCHILAVHLLHLTQPCCLSFVLHSWFLFAVACATTLSYAGQPFICFTDPALLFVLVLHSWFFFAVACATMLSYTGQQWSFGVMAAELARRVRVMLITTILKQDIG